MSDKPGWDEASEYVAVEWQRREHRTGLAEFSVMNDIAVEERRARVAAEAALAEATRNLEEKTEAHDYISGEYTGACKSVVGLQEQLRLANEENARLREQAKRLQDRDDYVTGCLV